MSEVVSFRPSRRELGIISRWQRRLGAKTRAAALRELIRRVDDLDAGTQALLRHRAPPPFRLRESITAEEIDRELYGDPSP